MPQEQLRNFVHQLQSQPGFVFTQRFLEVFPAAEMYVVGGAVRDVLLGKSKNPDVDLLMRGVAVDELQQYLEDYGKVELVGKRFGVLKFYPGDGRYIDIALPRTEKAGGSGARADFAVQYDPTLPIADDLGRRDFTVNAIAVNVHSGEVVDTYGGIQDLEKNILRTVGDPRQRFAEDYTRLIRGLRFAVVCGLQLEAQTEAALREMIPQVFPRTFGAETAMEVLAAEFMKSFSSNPVATLEMFDRAGFLEIYLPEVAAMKACKQTPDYHAEGDVWRHTLMALQSFTEPSYREIFHDLPAGLNILLATLWHDAAKPGVSKMVERNGKPHLTFYGHDTEGERLFRATADRLRLASFGGVDVEYVAWLIRNHLLLVTQDPLQLKATTFEKYFFHPRYPSEGLLQLYFADSFGCIATAADVQNIARKKIASVRSRQIELEKSGAKQPPLLSGDEIMRLLGIAAGPQVGELLALLREEQLQGRVSTKEEVVIFLKANSERLTQNSKLN